MDAASQPRATRRERVGPTLLPDRQYGGADRAPSIAEGTR
jgi:hypothetical protein